MHFTMYCNQLLSNTNFVTAVEVGYTIGLLVHIILPFWGRKGSQQDDN